MLNKEERLFHTLYSCGLITKSSIVNKIGGDEDLINDLMERKLLSKTKVDVGKPVAIYHFTKKGEKEYVKRFHKSSFYKNENFEKASKLSYLYCSLTDEEKKSWITQGELKEKIQFEIYPDAVFVKNNTLIGLFVCYESELTDDVKSKMKEFANLYKITVKVKTI